MDRLIPRRTKVKLELIKGLTIGDFIYLIFCGVVFALFALTNKLSYNIILGLVVSIAMALLVIKSNGVALYTSLGYGFRFLAFRKVYVKKSTTKEKVTAGDVKQIMPYNKIDGAYIDFGDYFASVVEVYPVAFFMLNEFKQNVIINSLSNALRRLTETQSASFYKTRRPMLFDDYEYADRVREEQMRKSALRGIYSVEELEARKQIFDSRYSLYDYYNEEAKVYKEHYYIVVYGKDKVQLDNTVEGIVTSLAGAVNPIRSSILKDLDLAIFLKSTYTSDFNEREARNLSGDELLDWVIPKKIKFKATQTVIDDVSYNHFILADYPTTVGNAWAYNIFSQEDAIVCMNLKQMPRLDAEKMIDNSILEMSAQLEKAFKASDRIEKESSLNTIQQLLADLKSENESLFNVTIHILSRTARKKEVRAMLKERGFKFNELFGRQVDAFISSNVSSRENLSSYFRGMQTTTVAGTFPFISNSMQDPGGVYMGYNEYPVLIDFFTRNSDRVNSNMVVIGRSGSGKSFATLTLLSQLAAEDARIFIIDPEKEYVTLTNSLGGKIVDVGSGLQARFNPLHIMESLADEDGEVSDSYSQHLQFLEEFFSIILEGISSDALETLNRLLPDLYKKFKIDSKTKLSELTPEDFPTFDDLYEFASQKLQSTKDEYMRNNLRVVINYIAKFATGGRNAGLWNGPTSVTSNENFIVFNFQTLLANRNKTVLGAQMLLTFKYLENEIIKNKDYNEKYNAKRKIILAVDEAHIFMNPKYPIALDFMYNMAKRIRKYNGMQIIITQNIRDFMGSEDMIRQSSAIIAASQYSMIFSLSPNDVTELVQLYKNAGEINETEQDQIATAGLGQCFFISGPTSRMNFKVEALDEIRKLFGK